MTLWLVRAGRHGEREQFAVEHNLAVIGWNELDFDLSTLKTKEELKKVLEEKKPGKTKNAVGKFRRPNLGLRQEN